MPDAVDGETCSCRIVEFYFLCTRVCVCVGFYATAGAPTRPTRPISLPGKAKIALIAAKVFLAPRAAKKTNKSAKGITVAGCDRLDSDGAPPSAPSTIGREFGSKIRAVDFISIGPTRASDADVLTLHYSTASAFGFQCKRASSF